MPKIKKSIPLQNLAQYDVYIEDTSDSSPYFNVSKVPNSFTGGRNSFLFAGSPFLKNNSTIRIEILDEMGKPIFQTVVDGYRQGISKMVAVEIYDTTVSGFATIIIMGKAETTVDGEPIPDEWKDVYNVRWSKKILVDYNLRNTSTILFKQSPELSVQEERFYNINSSSYDTSNINFTMSLNPISNGTVRQVGYKLTAESPSVFSEEYKDGFITGSLIVGENDKVQIYLPVTDILNSKTAITNGYTIPFVINDGIIKNLYLKSGSYIVNLDGTPYPITASAELRYTSTSISQINIPISYANLRVFNLNTVSGEIYKIKVYNKPTTNTGQYKLVGDFYIDTNEILVSSSIRGLVDIGDIFNTTNYNDNWYSGPMVKNQSVYAPIYKISGSAEYYNPNVTTNQFSMSASNDVLLSAIYAGVPVDTLSSKFIGNVSESGYFIGTKSYYTLSKNTEYTLSFNTVYKKQSGSVSLTGITPKVDIYLIPSESKKIPYRNILGQQIGTVNITNDIMRFDDLQFNFNPTIGITEKFGLRFVVSNGFWYFSNISLKPASDPRFSPDEIQLTIPNTEYHNELLEYKVEFFDINNNSVSLQAISTPVFFTGSAIDLGTLP
jgi:hypothetical protein